jgi:hypothetical protein
MGDVLSVGELSVLALIGMIRDRTNSATTSRIMTLSITPFSIMDLFVALITNGTEHNDILYRLTDSWRKIKLERSKKLI